MKSAPKCLRAKMFVRQNEVVVYIAGSDPDKVQNRFSAYCVLTRQCIILGIHIFIFYNSHIFNITIRIP
jgi:hypothetical protein